MDPSRIAILAAALIVCGVPLAADPPPVTSREIPAAPPSTTPPAQAETLPRPAPTFTPTEKISADSAVAFPVDI